MVPAPGRAAGGSATDARVRCNLPDGRGREVDREPGDVAWSDGGPHEVVNVGTTDDRGSSWN